jgi:hypothetical protein
MAVITIGGIMSMREPESFIVTPDDRQELVKCLNGVFPVDAGNFPAGDVFAFTAVFSAASWNVLKGYWQSRTKVDVIDHHNTLMENMRVVVKKYEYVKKFRYWMVTIELWYV